MAAGRAGPGRVAPCRALSRPVAVPLCHLWARQMRAGGHAVHLRQLAALDPAAGGAAVHRGAAGGGAALRLGAAEAGGWHPHQGMVYRRDISPHDHTHLSLGNTAAPRPLHSA